MDAEFFFHAIMTDTKSAKSNIAAKFQNALTVHFLPPIGVFWDIENCQVPKGKSAIALVQNIREKFFPNHREAEFMCVCDIHKESNTIIQELIAAQVTVVHISATSKNAADDKLKQCMRRFVDTHGSPATLLLISDDVNFATDLSDFRHRHNIRIILLHRGHTHESLIACSHEHYDFSTVAGGLPMRSPIKNSENRPCMLEVIDLPSNKKGSQLHSKLKRLSDNCGGKVLQVKDGKAIIRFANADAAERAQKRMDKEVVFGKKITVNFLNRCVPELNFSPPRDSAHGFNSSYEASASSSSSRNSSISPPRQPDSYKMKNSKNGNSTCRKQFIFPPPPLLNNQNYPTFLRQASSSEEFLHKDGAAVDSKPSFNVENFSNGKVKEETIDSQSTFKSPVRNGKDISAFSPFKKIQDLSFRSRYSQRNIGRVSPFLAQDSDIKSSQIPPTNEPPSRRNGHTVNEGSTNSIPPFSNSKFSSVSQNMTGTFSDIQRISDPVIYSSQWSCSNSARVDPSFPTGRVNMIASTDISSPIELHVSNLDPNFEVNEMKKILQSVFREHVMVLHISMALQQDGSAKATVKVPSLQDAQYAISQLHRRKIGHKRILISYVTTDKSPPFHILRSETIALLNDIPAKELPLIKFRELYERRYHRPIAVSELYKMRDTVIIQGDLTGRVVFLNPDYIKAPSLPDYTGSQEFPILEKPYCERHFHVSDSEGWAEQYSVCPLPLVYISLKTLATSVHTLLETHQGSLPLLSFCACYEAEIGTLPIIGTCETSSEKESTTELVPVNEKVSAKEQKGVPLEHLIACITGVEVAKSPFCIKKVQWLENKTPDTQVSRSFSPSLASQLVLFGREVMDLLKNQPHCLVPFNKFIPTYHHHFGRQCRVADYGFTKLIDLLEAIPHIVQVLGEGQNRQVTLTHRTQIKRFAAELLRILKSRASKQITLSEFALAYEQCIEKTFDITNYGVCEIEDMLDEVSENTIVTCISEGETVIGIPKREQTQEEIERTKQFALEVVELLKHTPLCSMQFNKFIPAYHHHFGKQCRVADYGFTKLIELFEAIPDVLDVQGTGEDKILNLVEKEQCKILSDRLISVLRLQPNQVINIDELGASYTHMHGHILRPSDFGADNMPELLDRMKSSLRVVSGYGNTYLTLVDRGFIHQISLRVRRLLMEQFEGKLHVNDLSKMYPIRFGQNLDLTPYFKDMSDVVKLEKDIVRLMPLQMLARDMILLLQEQGPQISFPIFGSVFQKRFGFPICTAKYGFTNMQSLFASLAEYFTIKGRKQKRVVCLNLYNTASPLPNFFPHKSLQENSPEMRQRHLDVLNQPVPDLVKNEVENDLMGFETPPVNAQGLAASANALVEDGKPVSDRDFKPVSNEEGKQVLDQDVKPVSNQDGQKVTDLHVKPSSDEGMEIMLSFKSEPKNDAKLQTVKNTSSPSSVTEQTTGRDSSSELPHYTALHQLLPVTACSAVQTSPVTYYFNSPSSYQTVTAQAPPSHQHVVVPHKPAVAQVRSVIFNSGVPVLRHNKPDMGLEASHCHTRDRPCSSSSLSFIEQSLSDVNVKKSNSDTKSVEHLTEIDSTSLPFVGKDLNPSSQSTPTRANKRTNRRNRIAAQFSFAI